jgi:hypothetical protein
MTRSLLFCLALAGCAPSYATSPSLITDWPPARYMASPDKLPDVAPGEPLFASNAQCSAAYVKETGKLVALQRWIAVAKK